MTRKPKVADLGAQPCSVCGERLRHLAGCPLIAHDTLAEAEAAGMVARLIYGRATPADHPFGGRTARLIRTNRATLFVDWDGLDDDPGMAKVGSEAAGRAFVDAWVADATLADALRAAGGAS